MNLSRIFSLARRIIRQFSRDRRTIMLLVIVPILVLTIGALIFRAEAPIIPLGIVNEDEGLELPVVGTLSIGDRVVEALADGESFVLHAVERSEVDAWLRDGTVQGVLVLAPDFSAHFQETRQANLELHLEGSNPTRSQLTRARVTEATIRAIAGLASSGPVLQSGSSAPELPVQLSTTFLFAGEQFDTMDYVAPVYIALLAIFFVFLLTCVSFLRERAQGTMERLLATPATRAEIVLGYMLGLGLFAFAQVTVILFYTIWVLKIHYLGNLGIVFLVVILLALVGVNLGILASAFARNEFQVVQFIPLLIIPQILLSGTVWAVQDMPAILRPFGYIMPLTYANWSLRDVMLKGFGLGEIWPYLMALLLFNLVFTGFGALTMRKEVG